MYSNILELFLGNKQLAKYASVTKSSLPNLKAIVVWDEEELDKDIVAKCAIKVYLW
jgi:hypothetical protein